MGLINPLHYIEAARSRGQAIAAFNIHNLETLQSVVEGAERMRAPVIIQTSGGTLRHMGLEYVAACCKVAAELHGIPIALHMDHCTQFDQLVRCLRAGYTSLMVDGSHLPYEENITLTKKVVEMAHSAGVMVEAELGRLGGVEDDLSVDEREAAMTDPEQAADFALRTGIDILAVSIGTAHGMYKGEPQLDFDRLALIRGRVGIPLVLHGASGVPEQSVRRARELGIAKVNIATEIKLPMADAIKQVFREDPEQTDPRVYLGRAKDAVRAMVRSKILLCGCEGLADLEV